MNKTLEQRGGITFFDRIFLRVPLLSPDRYGESCLGDMLADPAFKDALWLASPQFYTELEKQEFDLSKLGERKRLTLLKYINRACFRPTPFGAFASFTLSYWDKQPPSDKGTAAILHLLPSREHELSDLTSRPLTPGLHVMINPVLYHFGQGFRYLFSETDSGKPTFRLNILPDNNVNRHIFRLLNREPQTVGTLAGHIRKKFDFTTADTWDYIEFLISHQVLLTENNRDLITGETGPITGESSFWNQYRQQPWENRPIMTAAAKELEQVLGPHHRKEARNYFYGALERPTLNAGLNEGSQQELGEAIRVMHLLGTATTPTALREFTLEFKRRFDREKVPLLQAIDPDQGIRYGDLFQLPTSSLLLDDLHFPARQAAPTESSWTPIHHLFLKVWINNPQRSPHGPLDITPEILEQLEASQPTGLPFSQAAIFRKTTSGICIENAGGATSTALIGRFSVFSDETAKFCREMAGREAEVNTSVVFAEICQVSDPHIDNINRRSQLYEYIIPLNGYNQAKTESQLLPSDLLLSVYGEELILESRRLRRRVIPRLPTAYNYLHNELPVFRLLCDLQYQGLCSDLSFDLEKLFPGLDFYPRVSYRGVILSAAKWHFRPEEISVLLELPRSLGRLHSFLRNFGLPTQLCTGSGDQLLVFNLANDWEAEFFIKILKPNEKITLREYLAETGVRIGSRTHCAQYIAFFHQNKPVFRQVPLSKMSPKSLRRSFHLGSSWLYLKIYCSPGASDDLLCHIIHPFIHKYRSVIAKWFFIRYEDQGHHLRLRLKGRGTELVSLLPVLGRKLHHGQFAALTREFLSETYQQEIERYGAEHIEQVEDCFHAGSEWVLYALHQMKQDYPGINEELVAFSLVALMARCFFRDGGSEVGFYQFMAERLISSFAGGKMFRVELDKKYRQLSPLIREWLAGGFLDNFAMQAACATLLDITSQLAAATKS